MRKYDLSILIPSRSEEWLNETVKNILKQKRGKTEILVGLDGLWAEPVIDDHPDVRIIYVSESIGQRAMGNKLAKLSTAKYIAKTDAHVAFDEGFDVKLMEAMKGHDDWTIIPAMKNLHVFDWVCNLCDKHYYQADRPDKCGDEICPGGEPSWRKEVVFEPRTKQNSGANTPTAVGYRFTPDLLQFEYFDALKSENGEITESMSVQGSFFMLTRERYNTLNINDETWGGWGNQGSEVALKTWLSGGQVMVHRGTWYAHMFRTNGLLAFPWDKNLEESQDKQQKRARHTCAGIFKNNAWDKQTRPLSWLVERFWEPLQRQGYKNDKRDRPWTKEDLDKLKLTESRFQKDYVKPERGILYFTDNELPLKLAKNVQQRIRKIATDKGMELVSSTRKPMDKMGKNIVVKGERSYLQMFRQILAGLELMEADIVFMAEHDVLYPPEHFDFTPTEHKFYYDVNWVKVHSDGLCVSWRADQVSGLCAFRQDLLDFYRKRIETYDKDSFDRKFEPLSGEGSEQWESPIPYIDVRGDGRNLTMNKRSLDHFRKKDTAVDFRQLELKDIPGWELDLKDIY
jgi:hypothetical protein